MRFSFNTTRNPDLALDYLYRYVNNFGELVLHKLPIVKETPKGVWIMVMDIGYQREPYRKFVASNAKKRFAYPTEKEALVNFIKRTERHIKFARQNLDNAEQTLHKAKYDILHLT